MTPDGRTKPPAPARRGPSPSGARRLGGARAARVAADPEGTPRRIDRHTVAQVRESWLVEDRWWTDQPLRRRYWELVSEAGRDIVVFHDLLTGSWFRQR